MSSLILDSLEIRNFRTFRHLEISRLARVNLIVGENNVGKTTLLEALELYACRGSPTVALNLLAARDEVSQNGGNADKQLVTYNLFYGREPSLSPKTAIQIGSLHDSSNTLTMQLGLSHAFVNHPERADSRLPKVSVAVSSEKSEVIPLRSMGEGMLRLLGLVLAIVNAKDGLLLIDEFSNGLHHLVQVEVWRLIFDLASRLNVQVFATTHSRDTVEAFQRAGYENKEVEGFLFSLRNKQGKPGEVVALLFDEEDLEMIAYP